MLGDGGGKDDDEFDAALGALYFSFGSMVGPDGKKVPLKRRNYIVKVLHELSSKVAQPICRFFGLRYNFFAEHHPQAKKAGVTTKNPLILKKKAADGQEYEEIRHLVTIRIRLRVHPTKGDPQTMFISRGTQLAILLHELCHLRHMNHGKDFMLFLRDIFAKAKELGLFDPSALHNEIPSPWPWENEIFRRAGDVGDEELLALFTEHRALQQQQRSARQRARDADCDDAEIPPPPEPPPAADESTVNHASYADAAEPTCGCAPGRARRDPPLGLDLIRAFRGACSAHEANLDDSADGASRGRDDVRHDSRSDDKEGRREAPPLMDAVQAADSDDPSAMPCVGASGPGTGSPAPRVATHYAAPSTPPSAVPGASSVSSAPAPGGGGLSPSLRLPPILHRTSSLPPKAPVSRSSSRSEIPLLPPICT